MTVVKKVVKPHRFPIDLPEAQEDENYEQRYGD